MDEVILVLQTGGGTVTGYGLAAAQLQRIKNANIHLTIAVEQVAAMRPLLLGVVAAEPGRVVWDRVWRVTLPADSTVDERFMQPIEALLLAECEVTPRFFGEREYWLLAPRAD